MDPEILLGNIVQSIEVQKLEESLGIEVVAIDEMESLAPRREQNTNEATKRMVTALLLQIDALARTSLPVIVIGATSSPSQVDGALRRFGRFDREVKIDAEVARIVMIV